MLDMIKRHRFLFWSLIVLCVCILRAIFYYVYGQTIASAHLDGHYFASEFNIFIAIVLTIVFVVIIIVKRQKKYLLWLSIPAVVIAFAPIHDHIGNLFYCCPWDATMFHNHRWPLVIIAVLVAIFLVVLIVMSRIKGKTDDF